MPRRELAKPGDPSSVTTAISRFERFGHLEQGKLWPPPQSDPFPTAALSLVALSPDGCVALLVRDQTAWVLDTRSMIASPPQQLSCEPRLMSLSDDGSIAVFIAESSLYRAQISLGPNATIEPERIWQVDDLRSAGVLKLSADGRIAIAAHMSQRALVRVFDLEVPTLVHSFLTDTDDCVALHPGGRHLIAFGDDAIARVYGRDGQSSVIRDTAGGAISRDGTLLVTNVRSAELQLRLSVVDASGPTLTIRERSHILAAGPISFWDGRATFSPDGRHVLVHGGYDFSQLVSLETKESTTISYRYDGQGGLINGSTVLLPGDAAAHLGISRKSACIFSDASPTTPRAALCIARQADQRLLCVGISNVGIYGSIEYSAGVAGARWCRCRISALSCRRP